MDLYLWNNGIPTLFPSGTSVYTWANGTFTNPTILNGWSQTIGTPGSGQTLYRLSKHTIDPIVHLVNYILDLKTIVKK